MKCCFGSKSGLAHTVLNHVFVTVTDSSGYHASQCWMSFDCVFLKLIQCIERISFISFEYLDWIFNLWFSFGHFFKKEKLKEYSDCMYVYCLVPTTPIWLHLLSRSMYVQNHRYAYIFECMYAFVLNHWDVKKHIPSPKYLSVS